MVAVEGDWDVTGEGWVENIVKAIESVDEDRKRL